ncbi:hypothetical protein TorRG33x02_062240, partial [Trema orientale]
STRTTCLGTQTSLFKLCLCGAGFESFVHTLLHCESARDILSSCRLNFDVCMLQGSDFLLNLIELSKISSMEDFMLSIIIMWYIWFERDQIVHGESSRKAEISGFSC